MRIYKTRVIDIDALPPSAYLTRAQVAALYGFGAQALKKWAKNNRGPAITFIENRPRYRVADILAWLKGQTP